MNMMQHAPQGNFLFLGDFFIASYDWQKRMPFFKVHCSGVMDETVNGLLARLPEVENIVDKPDVILIMSGMNNVIEHDYTFLDNLRRIVISLTNRFPETEIIVNSLPLARIPLVVDNAIHLLNLNIKEMARQTGSCYLDIFDILAEKGEAIFEQDGLHLTSAAYEKWARSILEYIAFLFEDDAT
jgi:lysophospholipase L1-like esterase